MKKGYLTLLVSVMMFSASASALAKSCKDFPTQQATQKFYESRKNAGLSGWRSLDRDGDGRACDCNPGGNGKNCPKKKR
ncbi:excalibur calcium-binding domain-containing protein [Neisseria cinerea]|uniref:excalibur calcium-binding domain-containing protein n=1 Tax=Neisseria cinerea TaxID=483 RepID=UPI003988C5F2